LLTNLLDNALKYSGGKIDLSVSTQFHDGKQQLHIAVKDRGSGIPKAEHSTIFQAYSRLNRHDRTSQRSAGLGLAVCYAIAKAHDGDLILRDRSGGGSSFIFSLPIDLNQPQAMKEIE